MNLDKIITKEINEERELMKQIKELSDLDDLSKEMIRLRIYNTYKLRVYDTELEQA